VDIDFYLVPRPLAAIQEIICIYKTWNATVFPIIKMYFLVKIWLLENEKRKEKSLKKFWGPF
jgi:hypothetical protein